MPKVIEGGFGKKKQEDRITVRDMLFKLREALGDFEEENPEVAVEAACVIFIEDREFVLASNGLHPDTVNMLLDLGKFNLLTGAMGHAEEDYEGPVH